MAAELYPVAVIGGGASGMAAAVTAAGILGPGKVLLLERGARAGRKLLAAGKKAVDDAGGKMAGDAQDDVQEVEDV